ncbi:YggS family pyridoxal phosphate-dependent enzyme [Botrimarina hoheduenensis]|uniref:Pyridoxal phosphate homeostasis protein n=1 Tax=Botrimarina hoheduenensis TaxID=2528000 RepID=A0A5C5VQN2_9BACT|nr:YggS family pyridoxal phosphate-dependent enzyme [Botrimarina hoheduenensis]TWT40255.1 Pyridoxal phosphate homeostasis protein [Botrimarina hoheduenensis]
MPSADEVRALVGKNLAHVQERIAQACHAAGRAPETVRLIGVSKYVGPDETAELVAAGCCDLGESRPQQLWDKAETLTERGCQVRWRMIGHLQRNKVARTVHYADAIDSVDSRRLLAAIDAAAQAIGKQQQVLLEVNISGDQEKHGFLPGEVGQVVSEMATTWPNVVLRGLMGMASLVGGEAAARQNFADLRQLREQIVSQTGVELPELSMGMSGDFEAAIAEGSTLVRIGSALWAGL